MKRFGSIVIRSSLFGQFRFLLCFRFLVKITIGRELLGEFRIRKKQGLGKPALITLNYPSDAKLIAKEAEDVQA